METVTEQWSAEVRLGLAFVQSGAVLAWRRVRRSERGEGVISAAIAVLVMAFLGAAMWVAFNGTMHSAQSKVDTNVNSIGTGAGGTGASSGGGTGGAGGSGLP
jgi:hypothetical protein